MNTFNVQHPCFDAKAKHTSARVHLPVAPKCNIHCNYCSRKYDCVNESAPGITSAVLSPYQAAEYFKELNERLDNISVIGIAGPGDPFANSDETLETMRLIKKDFPEKIFCLSTNGLNIGNYIDDIALLGVSHVTITINAVNTEIGGKIYSWARDGKKIFRGEMASEVLLEKQLDALRRLKENNITVKINSVILPGINDEHIPEIAETVSKLGADLMNCIPVFCNTDSAFGGIKEPEKTEVFRIRKKAGEHIKQMSHCARCRADAVGMLGDDYNEAFGMLQEYALRPYFPDDERPYVAAATYEGILVNRHLGEADTLHIFKQADDGFRFVEERKTPAPGCGDDRWRELSNIIKDCRALLVSGVGDNPLKIIQNSGIRVIQMTGMIDEGLVAVYNGKKIKTVKKTDAFKCGDSCRGNATGCA